MSESSDKSVDLSFPSDDNIPVPEVSKPDSTLMTGHEHICGAIEKPGESEGQDVPMGPFRTDIETETMPQPSPKARGSRPFKENPEPMASSLTRPSISSNLLQHKLNQNKDKAGLCVICSCTKPKYGEPIENCTAPEKMSTCFGTKLGYSIIKIDPDLSKQTLTKLLCDLSSLQISSCGKNIRFLFYFFGHGTESEICLTDGNFKCSSIIAELQKIDRSMFKIAMFDSCRTEDIGPQEHEATGLDLEVIKKPIQVVDLPGQSQWQQEKHYPYAKCVNTLVIYATHFRSKAYYIDSNAYRYPLMKGCGLVTYFFTTLAPTMNQSLLAVLAEVRKEVDGFLIRLNTSRHTPSLPPQVLVYEDTLMGNVNLLAESKGEVRVKPIIEECKSSVISTTIQWVFRFNVDERIRTFRVICRDRDGKIMDIKENLTLKNVAEFKNESLEPNTTYYFKVAAVYKDGFEAESEKSSFTTPGRIVPQDISINPIVRGSSQATVMWKFDGDDSDLSGFHVKIGDEVVTQVRPSDRIAEIDGLKPAADNLITVVAVYKDDRQTEYQITYHNDKLGCAEIESIHLIRLSPPMIDVHWKFPDSQVRRPRHINKVFCNDQVATCPHQKTHTAIELEHGTSYTLAVETCYTDNEECLRSKEYPFTAPTKEDIKPGIKCSDVKQNSVVVTVTDPPLFQRRSEFCAEKINLPVSFRVRRTPVNNEADVGKFNFHIFHPDETPHRIEATPRSATCKLSGNIPGTQYRVKCEVDCSGETLSNEADFTSPKPHCIQKTGLALCSILIAILSLSIAISVLVPYLIYLREDSAGATYYALTDAVIQCGDGSSQHHQGINLKGLPMSDTLVGTFSAWLVRQNELKLYSQQVGPFPDECVLGHCEHYTILRGWREYLWEGSVISGFCCVQNQNDTAEKAASLYVFTSDTDAMQFQNGGQAENFIFSDTLTIPPEAELCFDKWGKDRPLIVTTNAYHFFVLHISGDNMNFTSEIILTQKYVNTSDYTNPKNVFYEGHTYFQFPDGILDPTDYVIICQAPDSLTHPNTSRLEAESLHIRSWRSPYSWRAILPVIAALGFIGFLFFTGIWFLLLGIIRYYNGQTQCELCVHMHLPSCVRNRLRAQYESLNNINLN